MEPYKLYGPEFSFIQDLDCFLSEYDEGFVIPLQLGAPSLHRTDAAQISPVYLSVACTVTPLHSFTMQGCFSPTPYPQCVLPAGAPPDVPEDSRVDHRFLRCALDILGAAARLMGSEDVQWVVARRLFSKEPFLDFAFSDPAARSFLLRSGFDLLETAVCRGIPVRA